MTSVEGMKNEKSVHRLANPRHVLRLAGRLVPWLACATVILLGVGLYFSIFQSPADYQQGDTVRIMYVHVPAAWMALFCYTALAGASAVGLIWRSPLADLTARATAPIGACFTFLALITGSLWGKPMWGSWWVWDARLTSVLVLFFLYLGYMALNGAFDDTTRGARASAMLALVGFVNVPIIKFSVDWWHTLHQPTSVLKAGGPAIHSSMLMPLLLMGVGYTTFYLLVLLVRVRGGILAARAQALRVRLAHG